MDFGLLRTRGLTDFGEPEQLVDRSRAIIALSSAVAGSGRAAAGSKPVGVWTGVAVAVTVIGGGDRWR